MTAEYLLLRLRQFFYSYEKILIGYAPVTEGVL